MNKLAQEPLSCHYCSQPVLKLTGSFVNVCESCFTTRLKIHTEAENSQGNAVTLKNTDHNKDRFQDPVTLVLKCRYCKTEFKQSRRWQQYCSEQCSTAYRVRNYRNRKKQAIDPIQKFLEVFPGSTLTNIRTPEEYEQEPQGIVLTSDVAGNGRRLLRRLGKNSYLSDHPATGNSKTR